MHTNKMNPQLIPNTVQIINNQEFRASNILYSERMVTNIVQTII